MKREKDFTSGPIIGPLLAFSIPIFLALLLQSLYGAVDLLVVGKFGTTSDVSGVSVGSHVMMTATHLVSSFAMGTTILLGQKIGEKDREACGRIIGTSIFTFLAAGVVMTVLMPLLSGTLVRWMNAPPEARDEMRQYISICGGGSIMIVAYNALGAVMRGMGDSRTPLMTVAFAGACNVIGDLLLVKVLGMGAAGAAIATVASQAISVAASLLILHRRTLPFTLGRENLRVFPNYLRRIVRFGAPVALQSVLVNVSFLVLLSITNSLGLAASAGVGVAEKSSSLIMLVPMSFMQSMSAFVAQNHGAGKHGRALRGLRLAVGISSAFGVVMFSLAFFQGDLLCRIFSSDPQVVAAGFDYLKAYAVDCLLTCFLFCFTGFYNGLGRTGFVMIQGVATAFLVRIPFAWLMSRFTSRLFYIGLSIPCCTVVQIIACFLYLARIRPTLTDTED